YKVSEEGQPFVDQNFDSYGIEYTFDDDTKLYFDGRCMTGAKNIYSSHIHGTKASAIGSSGGDCGGPSLIYKGLAEAQDKQIWRSADHSDPYDNEWNDLIDAVIHDKPYNEVKRGVEASVVSSMGRMAAHTGQEITFEQMLNSDHEFAPNIDKIDYDSPAPLLPDAKGMYPQPEPGRKTREY
ncbi:MAG TPA: hypothetical protein VGI81_01595, partial [Tepidisphaeraceae bacterium]